MTELDEKGLTVRDLITLLTRLPADAKVRIDGCDCSALLGGVYAPDTDNEVRLARVDHLWRVNWDDDEAPGRLERVDDDRLSRHTAGNLARDLRTQHLIP